MRYPYENRISKKTQFTRMKLNAELLEFTGEL